MIVTEHIVFVFVRFRIPKSDHMTPEAITNERDAWVKAIKCLCVDWKRKSHLENVYEAPEKDLTDVTESESKTQDNHVPLSTPPVPHSRRPRLTRTFPNVPAAFPEAPEQETASRESSEAEPMPTLTAQSRAVRKPDETPSAVPVTSPGATCSSPAPFVLPPPLPVPSAVPGPVPPAPLPPPLPMKSKPLSERTKAFHWDPVAQDKVSANAFCFIFRRASDVADFCQCDAIIVIFIILLFLIFYFNFRRPFSICCVFYFYYYFKICI